MVPSERESWISPSGLRRGGIRTISGKPRFVSAGQRAGWVAAGSPALPRAGRVEDTTLSGGFVDGSGLTTNPAALPARVLSPARRAVGALPADRGTAGGRAAGGGPRSGRPRRHRHRLRRPRARDPAGADLRPQDLGPVRRAGLDRDPAGGGLHRPARRCTPTSRSCTEPTRSPPAPSSGAKASSTPASGASNGKARLRRAPTLSLLTWSPAHRRASRPSTSSPAPDRGSAGGSASFRCRPRRGEHRGWTESRRTYEFHPASLESSG
jgi:hypothetical protein